MNMRGVRWMAVAACCVFVLPAAAAAGGAVVTSDDVGAGGAAVPRCDTAVQAEYQTSAGAIVGLRIWQLSDSCEGSAMRAVVKNSSNAAIASGSAVIPSDGDSDDIDITVPLTGAPARGTAAGWAIVIS